VTDTVITVDATKAGVTEAVPAPPRLDPVAAVVRPLADARTAAGGALPLAADPIPWDQVERATSAHVAAEKSAAEKVLAVPDADCAAVAGELLPAVAAIIADNDQLRDRLARDTRFTPEFKATARAEFDAERDGLLRLTVKRTETRLAAAEERACTWTPDPVPAEQAAADARVAERLAGQVGRLAAKHLLPVIAKIIADPANVGVVRQLLPTLADAYEREDSRLHGDGDLRRLIELAGRYSTDRHALVRAARLADIARIRGVELDTVKRDARFALHLAGLGSPPEARDKGGIPFIHG
jgi:hypothetical protein